LLGFAGKYPIITFEEYIQIALNASRVVGIYPELKNPVFINQHVCIKTSQKQAKNEQKTNKKYKNLHMNRPPGST
jgi:glycerophosphoryl diester phosphodiesterase